MADKIEPTPATLSSFFNTEPSDGKVSSLVKETETKGAEKLEVSGEQLKSKSEEKSSVVPEKTPPSDKMDEKIEVKSEEKKEEKPSEPLKESKPDPWESSDNPYLKRYKDTQAWAQKEHQEKLQVQGNLQQLNQQMLILQKKIDGTYDPTKDSPEAQAPTPEMIATASLNVGKTLASRNAAYASLGKEKVDAALSEFNDLFSNSEMVQQLVIQSDAPVQRAMEILDRYHFDQKYGNTPTTLYAAIEKEVLAKHEKTLREKITAEILEGAKKKDKVIPGLSSSRGGNDLEVPADNNEGKARPLEQIFGR